MEIRLKSKYKTGIYKLQKSNASNSAKSKNRTKLGASQKKNLPPQPKVIMVVDGKTGAKLFLKEQ